MTKASLAKRSDQQRRYDVRITTYGTVCRHVMARDESEAIAQVKALLFEQDGQTPKKTKLDAFAWDFPHDWAFSGEMEETKE